MSPSEFKNYYTILGVKKTASTDEIKKKFRQLALRYHPDRNLGNKTVETKFKEISEAYDVLSDKDKRSKYDRFGQYWQQSSTTAYTRRRTSSSASNPKVESNNPDFSQYGNFEEFINELLGRFSSTTAQTPNSHSNFSNIGVGQQSTPANSEASINLTFAEAFQGTSKRLRIGSQTLEVQIPAGVKSGSRIRLTARQSNFSNPQKDLYLKVKLNSHPFFSFEDDNLVCEVPITPDEAVLGLSISIPTPDGRVSMKVPPGINSGQVLRLRGKGWSSSYGIRTDQLVKIIIATPQQITPQEKEYYEKIRNLRTTNPRDYLRTITL